MAAIAGRGWQLAVLGIGLLSVCNTVALVVLAGREPPPAAASPIAASPRGPAGAPGAYVPGSGDPVEQMLRDTIAPAQRAAEEMDIDVSGELPTEAMVQAAIRSGSIDSAESAAVLTALRAVYQKLGMPFPRFGAPGAAGAPAAPPGPVAPPAPGADPSAPSAPSAAAAGPADPQIVGAWFTATVARLRREGKAAGVEVGAFIPSDAEIDAATATGDFGSPPAVAAMARLQEGFSAVGVPFPAPVVQ